MKQEIVTLIQNYPVSALILFCIFLLITVFTVLMTIGACLTIPRRKPADAVINPHRLDAEWRSVMTATGIRNSEWEKEHAAACKAYNERWAEAKESPEKPFEVKTFWYEYKGCDPTPIKHETDPGEIKGSLVVKNKFAIFTPTVATGIRDLPKIDLYNLQNTGMLSIDDFSQRIIKKWEDSPKGKRPAVLRVKLNTIAGQILADRLKDHGIPVEPKKKP